jgi:hypothetical protein
VPFWYYLDSDPPPNSYASLDVGGPTYGVRPYEQPPVARRWTRVSGTISHPMAKESTSAGDAFYGIDAPVGYLASFYVDDVTVE